MPSYTYTGEPDRYYPALALTPEPDGAYELEKNPGDGRWTPPDPEPIEEPAATEPATEAAPPAKRFGFRPDPVVPAGSVVTDAAPTTEETTSDASAL